MIRISPSSKHELEEKSQENSRMRGSIVMVVVVVVVVLGVVVVLVVEVDDELPCVSV